MARLRITYLLSDTGFTGSVRHTLEQANRLGARGHDVRVLSRSSAPEWMSVSVPFQELARITVGDLPPSDFVIAADSSMVRIAHECKQGVPVHWCRRYDGNFDNPDTDRDLVDSIYRLPTLKIAPSNRIQVFVQQQYGSRCWHIPSAIDASGTGRPVQYPKDSRWRVLLIGSGHKPHHGIANGLATARILKASGHDIELTRVSVSPMADHERNANVIDRWLGPVAPSSMAAIYHHADILIGPSIDEFDEFSFPAAEALASGVLPVLTDLPCHQNFGPGDRYALFVPPHDPAAMADAVVRILTEPELRERLSLAGRNVAERLDWSHHLDRLEQTLLEMRADYGPSYAMGRSFVTPGPSKPLATMLEESRYTFAGQFAKDRRVLDVGCGTGHGTIALAEAGARVVTGIDCSEIALAYATRQHADHRVAYRQLDAEELDLPEGSVDLVVAFGLLEDLDRPHDFLDGAVRALTEKGALLLSAPNPLQPIRGCGGTRAEDGDIADFPALQLDDTSVLDRVRSLLEPHFGKVVLFGQGREGDQLVIRGDRVDQERDYAFIAMAVHPQRLPLEDERQGDRFGVQTGKRGRRAA